ncbi:MAG: sialidase family protein [Candidatus Gracilibacteria bacterium]
MKRSIPSIIFCLFTLLFVFGCQSSEPKKTPPPPSTETNSSNDYFSTLQSLIASDEPFVTLTDFEINNLPRDVSSDQFQAKTAIQIGSLLFAFIDQIDTEVKWTGILISTDNGDTWKKFFTSEGQDVESFFAADGILYVDIMPDLNDYRGPITRYESTDGGKKWTQIAEMTL